jgi:hypothetical protein
VEMKEPMSAKSIAPSNDRKPPEIFCRSFIMRPIKHLPFLNNLPRHSPLKNMPPNMASTPRQSGERSATGVLNMSWSEKESSFCHLS